MPPPRPSAHQATASGKRQRRSGQPGGGLRPTKAVGSTKRSRIVVRPKGSRSGLVAGIFLTGLAIFTIATGGLGPIRLVMALMSWAFAIEGLCKAVGVRVTVTQEQMVFRRYWRKQTIPTKDFISVRGPREAQGPVVEHANGEFDLGWWEDRLQHELRVAIATLPGPKPWEDSFRSSVS